MPLTFVLTTTADAAVARRRSRPASGPIARLRRASNIRCAACSSSRMPNQKAGMATPEIEKIRVEVEAGYKRIKIKISPSWDYDIIKAVRAEFGGIPLMGDANSAYTLADIGKLMGVLKPRLAGRADMGSVSARVKQALQPR
mgnify:CR=1 FL=1